MNLVLFNDASVRDFFESAVTQQAERRLFNLTDADIRAQSPGQLIDGILTILSPGRLVVDPTVNEETRNDVQDRMRMRRWLEFSGSTRLLTLRPRQYYARPPTVTLLQPPASGQAGRVVVEFVIRTLAEQQEFDRYCEGEFSRILDYAKWVNEDLDHYDQVAKEWLLTLLEAKLKRLKDDEGSRGAGRGSGAGNHGPDLTLENLSAN